MRFEKNIVKKVMITMLSGAVLCTSFTACSNAKKEKDNQVVIEEIKDEGYLQGKEPFKKYVEETLNGKVKVEAKNILTYLVAGEDKKTQVLYGYAYFDSEEKANLFIDNVAGTFSDEMVNDYQAGDRGVSVVPTEEIGYPSYILSRIGTKVYYVSYEKEFNKEAEGYIEAMVK
ncbi:MAG: hypothetical protein E7254_06425 [Lachnospiraceae bacterium]|nr:hypothetical protein [Lachnospiraceae bacterium]